MQRHIGSTWSRWELHIHTPASALANEFANDWDRYFKALARAPSEVKVLATTDYLSIEGYKKVRSRWESGQLPNLNLVFPNIEFRISPHTTTSKGINLHLLISPEDSDHIRRIEEALARLTITYNDRLYPCTTAGLTDLGHAYGSHRDNSPAYRDGIEQFKVEFETFREWLNKDRWLTENSLIAVSSSSNDGTSGIRKDNGFRAVRQEILRFAHIIFSGNPNERRFWLGEGVDTQEKVEEQYGSIKPCFHGSDAHKIEHMFRPAEDRFCWIKATTTFDGLRQAVIEPRDRVWIGRQAPTETNNFDTIQSVRITNSSAFDDSALELNPGIVAVVGPRGSGKTALADIIASGARAVDSDPPKSSFVYRARQFLNKCSVKLDWADGASSTAELIAPPLNPHEHSDSRARYISQHFVEQLCAEDGPSPRLRREIEKVIFRSLPTTDRLGAASFQDLEQTALQPLRHRRSQYREEIRQLSRKIWEDRELANRLPDLEESRVSVDRRLRSIEDNLAALAKSSTDEHSSLIERVGELEEMAGRANHRIQALRLQQKSLSTLVSEIRRIQEKVEPQRHNEMKKRFVTSAISEEDWFAFSMIFRGNVDGVLHDQIAHVERELELVVEGGDGSSFDRAKITQDWPSALIEEELDKAKKKLGSDEVVARRIDSLHGERREFLRQREALAEKINYARDSRDRQSSWLRKRRDLYVRAFTTHEEEQIELERLYDPLKEHLRSGDGVISRLGFAVKRKVDLTTWAQRGEQLIDRRMAGILKSRGAIETEARKVLYSPWVDGGHMEVLQAMDQFLANFEGVLSGSKPDSQNSTDWQVQLADWLFSTDHIAVEYQICYDGVELEKLSPGTRGIVLLTLYLAVDTWDLRPLIIDQPEENLDPKSVFEELVAYFRRARQYRQIIIVTHNANLVVNTDVDQVIIASSVRDESDGLPRMTYTTGPLEDATIRGRVCELLEGGERAFVEREKRYRIHRAAQRAG